MNGDDDCELSGAANVGDDDGEEFELDELLRPVKVSQLLKVSQRK